MIAGECCSSALASTSELPSLINLPTRDPPPRIGFLRSQVYVTPRLSAPPDCPLEDRRRSLRHSSFGILSSFGFRISSFPFISAQPRDRKEISHAPLPPTPLTSPSETPSTSHHRSPPDSTP